METVTIHKAKTELSRLIERACRGEEIVIARGKKPVVRLVALRGRAGSTQLDLEGSLEAVLKFFLLCRRVEGGSISIAFAA